MALVGEIDEMTDAAVFFGRNVKWATEAEGALLAQLSWLDSAPDDLRQFAQAGDFDKFWRVWSKRVTARADRRLFRKRAATRGGLSALGQFARASREDGLVADRD